MMHRTKKAELINKTRLILVGIPKQTGELAYAQVLLNRIESFVKTPEEFAYATQALVQLIKTSPKEIDITYRGVKIDGKTAKKIIAIKLNPLKG